MKNVNYKLLRGLRHYDLGTPINSGYLRGDNFVLTGLFTQNATPITNSFVPQALSTSASRLMTAGLNAFQLVKGYNSAIDAGRASIGSSVTLANLAAGSSKELANWLGDLAAQNASTKVATTAGSKSFTAVSAPLNAMAALHGGFESIKTADEAGRSPLSSSDLLNASSRSTEYANGVAYDRIGGYDQSGASKYLRDFNNANMINQITSGLEAGSGIGGLIGLVGGPLGSLIGSGIGAAVGSLGGAITGWINRGKAKRKMHQAQENFRNAVDGYNTQSESEAASQGLRNLYYATHADVGISVNTHNPNALVQGGEPILKYKNGKLVDASMFPITPWTPERVDNIPVRLDKGDSKHGVIGNLEDPETGERLAVEARPWVIAYNSPDPRLLALGEANLNQIMEKQDQVLKMRKIKKYSLGKCLPMFDEGTPRNGWLYSVLPTGINVATNLAGYLDAKKSQTLTGNAFVDNPYEAQAFSMMSPYVNIQPQLEALNDEARYANYAIDLLALSPGAKMLSRSKLYADRMKNKSLLYANRDELMSKLRQGYVESLLKAGDSRAQRLQAANAQQIQDMQRAYAQKRALMDTRLAGIMSNINSGFENLFNWDQFVHNYKLWRDDLDIKRKQALAKINKPD